MENVNSVAYINRISKIVPIEGADKIELASVNGWTSIIQKGIHKVNDVVLCITTDAVIPDKLCKDWNISYLKSGNRVRTVKLKGVYSECILIPTKEFPRLKSEEGLCLMDYLEIYKYEPPAREVQVAGDKTRKVKYRDNSNFHIYYKFPNQKNVPHMFIEGDICEISRKIHGTNARYGIVKKSSLTWLDKIKKFFGDEWVEYEYVYGSHNVEKGSDSQGFYSTDVWKEIADKYNIKENLWYVVKNCTDKESLGSGLIVYGEIYGEGIQGDKYSYGLKTKEFVGFDVEVNGSFYNETWTTVNLKHLKLPQVPLLYFGPWRQDIQDSFTFNQYIEGTKIPHEGIVVKCWTGDKRKRCKVINPEYKTFEEKFAIPDSH